MYKTVSLNSDDYMVLDYLSERQNIPKTQILSKLISAYQKIFDASQEKKRMGVNKAEKKIADSLDLPQGLEINIDELEKNISYPMI